MVKIQIFGKEISLLKNKIALGIIDFTEADFYIWSRDNIFRPCLTYVKG